MRISHREINSEKCSIESHIFGTPCIPPFFHHSYLCHTFSRVTRALSFTVSRSSSLASLYPRCFFHGQHLRGENVATKILILCTLFSIYVRIIASLVIFNVWITRNIYNIGIIIRWKDYVRNSENVIDRCTRKTDRQARKRIDRFARARTIDRDHSLHFHHALLFVSRKIKNDAIFHKHIFRILMQRDYDTLKFSCTRRVYEIVQFIESS